MKPFAPSAARSPMSRHGGLLLLALLLSLETGSAWAQLGVPGGGGGAASSPQPGLPLRRVPNLTNSGDAQRDMDLNNEQAGGKVVPQVRIPLGRNTGGPVFEQRRSRAPAASSPVRLVDDAAARCESQTDARARAACRATAGKP